MCYHGSNHGNSCQQKLSLEKKNFSIPDVQFRLLGLLVAQ